MTTSKEQLRAWRKGNPEKMLAASYRYLEKNPAKKLLKASRANAKSRGLEHSISVEDISIPTHCSYLGIELTSKVQPHNTANSMSIDRIDSSKGYIKGNVEVISNLANRMKSNATKEQLVEFAKHILERYD